MGLTSISGFDYNVCGSHDFILFVLIRSGPQGPDIPVQLPGRQYKLSRFRVLQGSYYAVLRMGLQKIMVLKKSVSYYVVEERILSQGRGIFGILVLQIPETYAVPFLEILQYALVRRELE